MRAVASVLGFDRINHQRLNAGILSQDWCSFICLPRPSWSESVSPAQSGEAGRLGLAGASGTKPIMRSENDQ